MKFRKIKRWGITFSIVHNFTFDGPWVMRRNKIKRYSQWMAVSKAQTVAFKWKTYKTRMSKEGAEIASALSGPMPKYVRKVKENFTITLTEKYYQPQKLLKMSELNASNLVPQKFVGTKEVMATPMTRGSYNTYRGWEIPQDEDPLEEGYLVEYLDSPKSNHPAHANYISWSPKDVFDRAYKNISDFKSRLTQELSELSEKAEKLGSFLGSENFTKIDVRQQELLKIQHHLMKSYEWVLTQRLNLL